MRKAPSSIQINSIRKEGGSKQHQEHTGFGVGV
jgi:hypothetical protein